MSFFFHAFSIVPAIFELSYARDAEISESVVEIIISIRRAYN